VNNQGIHNPKIQRVTSPWEGSLFSPTAATDQDNSAAALKGLILPAHLRPIETTIYLLYKKLHYNGDISSACT